MEFLELVKMIDSSIVTALLTAVIAGAAGLSAAIRTVYTRTTRRIDGSEAKIEVLHVDLAECHKQHAQANARLEGLEGWRAGFAAGSSEPPQSKPVSETETN